MDKNICFLSGLEIPKGRVSREHYYPISLLPPALKNIKQNIFSAHKVINEIKSNMIPCCWEDKKFERVFYAINHYNLRSVDIEFCRKTLENWEVYRINPCQWCIMQNQCGR